MWRGVKLAPADHAEHDLVSLHHRHLPRAGALISEPINVIFSLFFTCFVFRLVLPPKISVCRPARRQDEKTRELFGTSRWRPNLEGKPVYLMRDQGSIQLDRQSVGQTVSRTVSWVYQGVDGGKTKR